MGAATEQTVREMIAAWNQGNVDRMIDFWVEDDDWIWVDAAEMPGGGTFRGREAVEAHLREFMEIFDRPQITIDAVTDMGDEVFLIDVSGQVRGSLSGIELDTTGAQLVGFENGRVRWYRVFGDREEARAAARADPV